MEHSVHATIEEGEKESYQQSDQRASLLFSRDWMAKINPDAEAEKNWLQLDLDAPLPLYLMGAQATV